MEHADFMVAFVALLQKRPPATADYFALFAPASAQSLWGGNAAQVDEGPLAIPRGETERGESRILIDDHSPVVVQAVRQLSVNVPTASNLILSLPESVMRDPEQHPHGASPEEYDRRLDESVDRYMPRIMLAQRAARATSGLMLHGREFDMEQAVDYASKWTPRGWLPDGDLVRFEQQLYLRQPGYGTSYVAGKAPILEVDRVQEAPGGVR